MKEEMQRFVSRDDFDYMKLDMNKMNKQTNNFISKQECINRIETILTECKDRIAGKCDMTFVRNMRHDINDKVQDTVETLERSMKEIVDVQRKKDSEVADLDKSVYKVEQEL